MKDLEVIRRWMKESVDPNYYDLLYTLQLYMSGDFDAMSAATDGGSLKGTWNGAGGELASYPDIMPGLGPTGLQNHGLVNARINIQGLHMEPEFIFEHPNPVMRQYNAAFVRKRWTEQKWGGHIYRAGMELEANGIGCVREGLSDGKATIRHCPILDTLWDRSHDLPDQWRWVATRDRLSPEEVKDIYGDALTKAEIDGLTVEDDRLSPTARAGVSRQSPRQLVEWSYYDRDHHVVFLGSVHGSNAIVLALNSKYEYRKAEEAGPNPFGIIPARFWIDSWAPGIRRPVAKSETTIRLSAMLNEVEKCLVETCRNGIPVTAMDLSKIDKALHEDIKNATSWAGLKTIIPLTTAKDIREVISRMPALEVPNTLLVFRSILKEELNAATGVQDMMRGQALTGEKTKFEIQSYNDQAGIQGRHLRETFTEFCEGIVADIRAIAAQHDEGAGIVVLPDYGEVPLKPFVKKFLSVEMAAKMSPESVTFKTDQQRQIEAMQLFTTVLEPLIQLQALDPVKVATEILSKFGYKDPIKTFGRDPIALPPGMVPGAMPIDPAQATPPAI